jgi:hypothetical protein
MSSLFLSEINMVVITYKFDKSEDLIVMSIVKRLIQVLTKVYSTVLPSVYYPQVLFLFQKCFEILFFLNKKKACKTTGHSHTWNRQIRE